MIDAKEARKLSDQTRKLMASDDYAYMKMENAIKRSASTVEGGRTQTVFEETPGCFFNNPRDVKKNLMKLGYEVDIERFNKGPFVLNRYYIAW